MINVKGTDVDLVGLFDNYQVSQQLKVELTFELSAGLSLPYLIIEIDTDDLNLIGGVSYGKKFKFIFGNNSYDYVVAQWEFFNGKLKINSYLDRTEFFNVYHQKAIANVTSVEALSLVKSLAYSKTAKSNDKQTWIMPNLSEREFVRNTILHSYVSDEDFLLSYISDVGELKVNNYSELLGQEQTIKFGSREKEFRHDGLGLFSLPVILRDRIDTQLGVTAQGLATNEYGNIDEGGRSASRTLIDAGNTHPRYASAPLRNLKFLNSLYAVQYVISMDYFTELMPPQKLVEFNDVLDLKGIKADKLDLAGKKFLISKTRIKINATKITQQIFVSRIKA